MKSKAAILVFFALILGVVTTAFSATEIRGVLDQADQKYIIVNKHKYPVSKSTVIIINRLHAPKNQVRYFPRYLPHNSLVTIKLENGIVKQITVLGVPQ